MKIYISGKISGIEDIAPEIFDKAAKELEIKGLQPINPMAIQHEHDGSWHNYMKRDIQALCDCEAIFMLHNWTESRGAIIEHSLAMLLGMKIHYQTPNH